MQTNNAADYYKKKFDNIKKKARQREVLLQKQKQTGGGQLTKAEQRIVESQAYTDLALKLGKSAVGNEPRSDSDAVSETNLTAPTKRLQNILDCENERNETMIENENEFGDDELPPPCKYTL